jgi:hypothetical protein
MPTSTVATKEMIGQDSQNMFDLYGHTGGDSADDSDATLDASTTGREDPSPVAITSSGNVKIDASRLATITELPSPVRPPETTSTSYAAAYPLSDHDAPPATAGDSCPSPVISAFIGKTGSREGPNRESNTELSSPVRPTMAVSSNVTRQMSRRDAPASPRPYAEAKDAVHESRPSPVKSETAKKSEGLHIASNVEINSPVLPSETASPSYAARHVSQQDTLAPTQSRTEADDAVEVSRPSDIPSLSTGAQPTTQENAREPRQFIKQPSVDTKSSTERVIPASQRVFVKARTDASDRATSSLTGCSSATGKSADLDIGIKKPFTLPPGAKLKGRKKKI